MNKLAIGLLTILCACKSAQIDTSNDVSEVFSVNEIVVGQLGQKYERKDKGDFSLCYSLNKVPGDRLKTVIVVNNKTGETVYGPVKLNADVDWHSETQLIIKEHKGIVEDRVSTNTSTYYYDVVEKKKITN